MTRTSQGLHTAACVSAAPGCKDPTEEQELQTVAVSARLGFTSAGGRLSRRFRPQGQAAGLGQASSVGQPPGQHQWQDMADVSISGSEAGPSGRQAMPDDDPSLYTHRSNRLALFTPIYSLQASPLNTHCCSRSARSVAVAANCSASASIWCDVATAHAATYRTAHLHLLLVCKTLISSIACSCMHCY